MTRGEKKEKALVVKEDAALEVPDYGDDAGAGEEDQTLADLAMPFLVVLQTNSPQCEKGGEKYVEGVEPGQLFNTVSEESYDSVAAVLCSTERIFMRWVKRTQGGGLVGKYDPDSEVVQTAKAESESFGKYEVEGDDLTETFYLYWLLTSEQDAGNGAMMAATGTKITPYKKWNSKRCALKQPNGKNLPIFAHQVTISTVRQKNANGSFFNIVLTPTNGSIKNSLLPPGSELLESAKAFRSMIKAGDAKIDYEGDRKANEGAGDDDDDGEIPF